MAFIRWRGNSAQLVATRYDQGRSHQVVLAALGTGYRMPSGIAERVTQQFPDIRVDWDAIARAIIQGPPDPLPTPRQKTYGEVEHLLRCWADQAATLYPRERTALREAADVLTSWRAREDPRKH